MNSAREREKRNSVPLISVILPVFNVGTYLDRCMISVTGQTLADCEILLVDDGSTDGSGERCEEWAACDPRVRVIHQANAGVAAARNAGLAAAGGKYLAFIDPDDWVETDYLEKLVGKLEETGGCMAVCDLWRYDNRTGKKILRNCSGWMQREWNLTEHMRYAPTALYKAVFRRSLWEDNGIRFPLCAFESPAVYALVTALAGRVEAVHEPLYWYRRFRENSLIETGYAHADGSSNDTCGVEAMEHLLSEFSRLGLYERYRETLRGVVTYRLTDILAMQFHRRTPEDYARLADNFRSFLAGTFGKDAAEPYVIVGGYNLNRIGTHLPRLQDPYDRYNFTTLEALTGPAGDAFPAFTHRNRYRQMMLERERTQVFWENLRKRRPSFLLLDLTEERHDLALAGQTVFTAGDAFLGREPSEGEAAFTVIPRRDCEERFRTAARAFFDRVTRTVPGIRIAVVENHLCEKHGNLKGQTAFTDAEEIRRTNHILSGYYRYLEDILPEAIFIRPAGDALYFTDDAYEYGCVPEHINELENRKIAEEIARVFEQRD